jgi:predicted transcriptional regulator
MGKTTTPIADIALEETISSVTDNNNKKRLQQLLIKDESIDVLEQACIAELHNNDFKILSFLLQEGGRYQYTFNGLARKLEIHQQSLARSLHRLIELRLIEKSNDGYRLKKKPNTMQRITEETRQSKEVVAPDSVSSKKPYTQLTHAYLPLVSINDAMVHNLIGKRFGNLLWAGLIDDGDNGNGYRLQWTGNESPFLIVMNITSGYLTIETNAVRDKEKVEATVGACRIFERVLSLMREKASDEGNYIFALDINHAQDLRRVQNN